eukprot:m.472062 g.472062  ORF g.472062 m.472062 type:complete len:77 (+) comp32081_c0_seq1:1581-1811(+)
MLDSIWLHSVFELHSHTFGVAVPDFFGIRRDETQGTHPQNVRLGESVVVMKETCPTTHLLRSYPIMTLSGEFQVNN